MKILFGVAQPEEARSCASSIARYFWYFWLTIQNTANWHVSNALDLLSVFTSFPLVNAEAGEANLSFPLRPRISCARSLFFGKKNLLS
jgi:hypothetical protein